MSQQMGLSQSEAVLAERVAALPWTAHNIHLTERVWTLPGQPEFIQTDGRLAVAKQLCRNVFGPDLSGIRVADLGCLEGGYSLAFALEGATVLGIEGRAINVQKCKLIEEQFAMLNLRFVQDDVKNFTLDSYGSFDVVLVCGLLYHLDDPARWLHQMAPCVKTLLFLDTHYAPESDAALFALSPPYPLSELIRQEFDGESYQGRWFQEYSENASADVVEQSYWAAVSNYRSLWLTRPSLYKALHKAGFTLVGERADFVPSDEWPDFLREKSRSCFFAYKA